MVVSTAFGELAEVLHCLESTDVEVRDIAVEAGPTDETDEITADLHIGVPVLSEFEFGDDVSIEAEGTDLTDEKLSLSVSVTVPTADVGVGGSVVELSRPGPVTQSNTDGVPAYKDPEALESVYETYDSFPEMTDALGVDVTPETVRRYMVKHDIHDPEETTDPGELSESDSPTSAAGRVPSEAEESQAREHASDESDTEDQSEAASKGTTAQADSEPTERSEDLPETSMADVLAAADREEREDTHAADGLGIPRDLTVAEFATIIEESRTVYEVARRLDMEFDHAGRFLDRFDLREWVTGRLTAQPQELTTQDVYRRLGVQPPLSRAN